MGTRKSVGELEAHKQPWEVFDLPEHSQQTVYRDWGIFYTRRLRTQTALNNFDKSLNLEPEDWRALYFRSKCNRIAANTKSALDDCRKAAMVLEHEHELKSIVNLGICDSLYDLNKFVDCLMELYNSRRKFTGKVGSETFQSRLHVILENFADFVGPSLNPFIYANEKVISRVHEEYMRTKSMDDRPLWKILKEESKCDVLSVLEKEGELLSPMEIARRRRTFEVFTQFYINKSWIDVAFLKNIRKNSSFLMPEFKDEYAHLKYLISERYDAVRKFLRMLHARSPMYNEYFNRFANKKLIKSHREATMNFLQYQTLRRMRAAMRIIKDMRKNRQYERMAKYIEEVTGDYMVIKTTRVSCWKFEFLNEVYNFLALSYCDQYKLPAKFDSIPVEIRALKLLNLPVEMSKAQAQNYTFGDRSTFSEPDKVDPKFVEYQRFVARLEYRLHFSKYPIEKCYLLHQTAQSHLKHSRFNEAVQIANKAIAESKNCKSLIWQFLSLMVICKANALLHKIERARDSFEEAFKIAYRLKSCELAKFTLICQEAYETQLQIKHKTQSLISRGRSLYSNNSQGLSGGLSAVQLFGNDMSKRNTK